MVRLFEVEQDLRYVQEQTGYASRRTIAKYVTIGGDQKKTMEGGSADLAEQATTEQIGRDSELTQTCDACGAKVAAGSGKRIESGQFLCDECLKYFHTA